MAGSWLDGTEVGRMDLEWQQLDLLLIPSLS